MIPTLLRSTAVLLALCLAASPALANSDLAHSDLAQTPPFEAPPVAVSAPGWPQVILPGDYPDPSILRDGADYYMTHSEYNFAPAFLIWHSTDLIHWAPVTRAMAGSSHSYAPDLTKVGGRYYIYYPAGGSNWVISADNIRGPWSAPVDLKLGKIDPGHAVGEDGRRYLFTSAGRRVRLSDDGLSTAGAVEDVYGGWTYPADWKTECKCLESPKLFRKGAYVYMVSAEGGTAGPATSHMAVVARAKGIDGPWENSPYNPLVHTYGAEEPWWSKGHGTIVDDVNGNWWIVYHAYRNGAYTLGRSTLIDPIDWTDDGWPVLSKTGHLLPGTPSDADRKGMPLSDDFSGPTLGLQWTSLGTLDGITLKGGAVHVQAEGTTPPTAKQLILTATDPHYDMQVEVRIEKGATGGLAMIYSGKAFAGITSDGSVVTIYRSAGDSDTRPSTYGRHFYLRIDNDHEHAAFFISRNGKAWDRLASDVDVSGMNHNVFRGFLALRPTLTASGAGRVTFDTFRYTAVK